MFDVTNIDELNNGCWL